MGAKLDFAVEILSFARKINDSSLTCFRPFSLFSHFAVVIGARLWHQIEINQNFQAMKPHKRVL